MYTEVSIEAKTGEGWLGEGGEMRGRAVELASSTVPPGRSLECACTEKVDRLQMDYGIHALHSLWISRDIYT